MMLRLCGQDDQVGLSSCGIGSEICKAGHGRPYLAGEERNLGNVCCVTEQFVNISFQFGYLTKIIEI